MWDKVKKILGYVWAGPVTAAGLIYSGTFKTLGWYAWYGVNGDALVFVVDEVKSPAWLLSAWKKWAGHTIGNVVVFKSIPDDKSLTLTHELKHVDQCMRLGIFQPIMYGLNMLAIKLGCPGSDPYYTNPFEIDARRAAGQIVDVEGTIKKFRENKKTTS
jgi:hypothetical protein